MRRADGKATTHNGGGARPSCTRGVYCARHGLAAPADGLADWLCGKAFHGLVLNPGIDRNPAPGACIGSGDTFAIALGACARGRPGAGDPYRGIDIVAPVVGVAAVSGRAAGGAAAASLGRVAERPS